MHAFLVGITCLVTQNSRRNDYRTIMETNLDTLTTVANETKSLHGIYDDDQFTCDVTVFTREPGRTNSTLHRQPVWRL